MRQIADSGGRPRSSSTWPTLAGLVGGRPYSLSYPHEDITPPTPEDSAAVAWGAIHSCGAATVRKATTPAVFQGIRGGTAHCNAISRRKAVWEFGKSGKACSFKVYYEGSRGQRLRRWAGPAPEEGPVGWVLVSGGNGQPT